METTTALLDVRESGGPVERERLLNEHLGLVHHVARKVSRTLTVEADFDELVSAGSMGLMNALDTFDASRGLAFSTFAAPRIRGSILDELRRQDHVPRSVRRKTREIGAARESLMRKLQRAPEDREVAAHMGIDMQTFWRWTGDVEGTTLVPLDERPGGEREGRPLAPVAFLAGETHDDIEGRLNREEEARLLRDAILRLRDQERTVLNLYYFEELKLHEIATILGLTESRVSQIRSKAVSRLRAELEPIREQVA